IHLAWDLDKLAETVPGGGDAIKAAMKKLLGEDMHLWVGTDGKRVVTLTANDWNAARKNLDGYLDGSATLGKEAAYKATRSQLPAETSLLALTDAGPMALGMGNYMLAILKAVPQLPINLPESIKPVTTKTSYLGVAMTLKPENASF